MKNMKKLTAVVLTLIMSLTLAVPCFATDSPVEKEVYDLGNGVIATITVQPADSVPKPFVAKVDVSGTANPSETLSYRLHPADGGRCDAHVMNMAEQGSGMDMSVHFEVVFYNGQRTEFKSLTVSPRMTANISLNDTTGTGLDCDIVTDISAVNSDSIGYNYWHFQEN